MKIVITIEDVGNPKHGTIKLSITPKIHILRKMAQAGEAPPSVAYAGLVMKKIYEVMPHGDAVKLQGDDKTVYADATQIQNNRAKIKDSVLTGSKQFKKTESGLIIPK